MVSIAKTGWRHDFSLYLETEPGRMLPIFFPRPVKASVSFAQASTNAQQASQQVSCASRDTANDHCLDRAPDGPRPGQSPFDPTKQ